MLPKSKNFAAKAAFATFQPPCARSYVKQNAEQSRNSRNRNFTTVSNDPCARSYVKHNAEHSRDKPRTNRGQQKSQFYYSFGRSMRTILRKTQCGTLAAHQTSQFYYSFGRSMRTILRKGCRGTVEIAILLQFRAIDAHDPT